MGISIKPDGEDRYIVNCPDEMDWTARLDLVREVKAATEGRSFGGLIVDLGCVTYMNSAGLGAIFALRKFARQAGAEIVICCPSVSITRLLNTVNLPQLIPVTDSLDDARLKLLKSAPGASA